MIPVHIDGEDTFLTRLLNAAEGVSIIGFRFLVFLFCLYLLGNAQAFDDENSIFIIRFLGIAGFAVAMANALSVLIIIMWSVRHRHAPARLIVVSSLRLVLGSAFAVSGPLLLAIFHPVESLLR